MVRLPFELRTLFALKRPQSGFRPFASRTPLVERHQTYLRTSWWPLFCSVYATAYLNNQAAGKLTFELWCAVGDKEPQGYHRSASQKVRPVSDRDGSRVWLSAHSRSSLMRLIPESIRGRMHVFSAVAVLAELVIAAFVMVHVLGRTAASPRCASGVLISTEAHVAPRSGLPPSLAA